MRHFKLYYLLGIILFSFSAQNGLSQQPTGICSYEFWPTATPSDVILELELSGIDINSPCDEETGDRPIHIALMRSNNYLAIEVLFEFGASLLVSNKNGETPVILTEQMYHTAQTMLEQNKPRLLRSMKDFLTQRVTEHSGAFDEVRQQLQDIMRDFLNNNLEDIDEGTDKASYLQAKFEEALGELRSEHQYVHFSQDMQDFESTDIYTNQLGIRRHRDFLRTLLNNLRELEEQEQRAKALL